MKPAEDSNPEPVHSADALRTSANVFAPDQRSTHAEPQLQHGAVPAELEQRLRDVGQFELHPAVPVRIRIHFETAKNLYAYSWFVYRFHMVAQQHALATLELALRTRFYPPDGVSGDRGVTLRPLLERAVKEGLLAPDKFGLVRRMAVRRAKDRQWHEAMIRLRDAEVEFVDSDDRDAAPLLEDYCSGWLQDWVEVAPNLRNMHAHGTSSLWPTVLGTFENVMDTINQLWAAEASPG